MNASNIDTHPPSGPSPRPQIFVLLSIPLPVENPVPNPPPSLVLLAQLAVLGIVDEDDAVVNLLEDVVQGEAVGRELSLPDSLSDALESPVNLGVLNAVRRGLCDGTR